MKIAHLILSAILFILLLFSITTYINYKQAEKVRYNADYLQRSADIVRYSNQYQKSLLYMERNLKGFLLSGQSFFIDNYTLEKDKNDTLLKSLFSLIPPGSKKQAKLVEIETLYNQWLQMFAEPVIKKLSITPGNSITGTKSNQALELRAEEALNNQLRQKFRELLNYEYEVREQRKLILQKSVQQTKVLSFSLTIFSILTGFVIALFLQRHISNRISKMVRLADEISRGNYNVQVNDDKNDELTDLSNSLNKMAVTLSSNISLLQSKNKELDQFAYIVSHDLKSPLQGINLLIKFTLEDYKNQIPHQVHQNLNLVEERIHKAENLIFSILNYARAGKEVHDKELVDVSKLVAEVVDNLEFSSNIKITIDELPIIYSERLPLNQVFSNLISNAIKYSEKQFGFIKVFSEEQDNYYLFNVEDNGPGIKASEQEKIFDLFKTVHSSNYLSTGVGLSIVKKILDERNERIEIVSEVGKGSTFRFTWSKQKDI